MCILLLLLNDRYKIHMKPSASLCTGHLQSNDRLPSQNPYFSVKRFVLSTMRKS